MYSVRNTAPNKRVHATRDTAAVRLLHRAGGRVMRGVGRLPAYIKGMSTDFIALFDASTDVTPKSLLARLAADPRFGAGVIDHYRELWLPKTWVVDTPHAMGGQELLGPGGFAIRAKPKMIELYHMMPFRTFASDPESRDALRRSCMLVADAAGSARAIYTHELMPYDGAALDEIEGGLRAGVGPPASSFEELREAEYYGPRAWFIDTFADLRQSNVL